VKKSVKILLGVLAVMAVAAIAFVTGHNDAGVIMALSAPAVALMQGQSGVSGFSRVEETLLNYVKQRNPELAPKYFNRELRFKDDTITVRTRVDGFSGTQEVLNASIAKVVGLNNVDKGQLDKDVAFAVSKIKLEYADSGGAVITDPTAVATYTQDVGGWPVALHNAEIEILQDDNILINLPAKKCGVHDATIFFEGFELSNPFILEPEKQIIIRFKLANGQTINAANTEFTEVSLQGVSTRKRGMV
jgi:hypothetical protein